MKPFTKEDFIKLAHPTYHTDKAAVEATDRLYENLLKACSWIEHVDTVKDKYLQENINKLQEDEYNEERIY